MATQLSCLPEWELKRSRRKTLELRVYPDGRVEVRAPMRASNKEVMAFVASRQQWLQRQLEDRRQQPQPIEWRCIEGASLPLLGEPHRLCLCLGEKAAWRSEGNIYLRLPEPSEAGYQKLLEAFLRKAASELYGQLINHWFAYFSDKGCQRSVLRIKKMKSRWGSLSTRGYINLNLALMLYSVDCVEAVVVHELCHLLHMNHGAEFKALQTQLLPDWRQRKSRLEQQARRFCLPF